MDNQLSNFFPKYQEGQSAKLIAKLEAKPPDLDRIGAAVHLQLASFRTENTLRKPVVIWVVRVGDEL